VYDLATSDLRVLSARGTHARYVPSGHLVFARDGALVAVSFDIDTLEVTGEEVAIIDSVEVDRNLGYAQFDVSHAGTLVYAEATKKEGVLSWVDRQGNREVVYDQPMEFRTPRLSPDGRRVALWVIARGGESIWVYDLARHSLDRVTRGGNDFGPEWSTDGDYILYGSDRSGAFANWRARADGTGEPEPLALGGIPYPFDSGSLSPDGALMALTWDGDIYVVAVGSTEAEPWFESAAHEATPAFSPDGRWIAYVSSDQGPNQVYVRSYPDAGNRRLVSLNGGYEPRWSRDGKELYFRTGDTIMAVPFDSDAAQPVGQPTPAFNTDKYLLPGWDGALNYDAAEDGRLLVLLADEPTTITDLKVVVNWFEELAERAPAGSR